MAVTVPQIVQITINGTDYTDMVDGPISCSQTELDLTGLIIHSMSFRLTRWDPATQPRMFPWENNDLCDGRLVEVNIFKQDGTTLVPLPNFHTMHIEKVDPYRARGECFEYCIVNLLCRLGYRHTQQPKDNRVEFDPLVGDTYSNLASVLLRSQGILEGETSSSPVTDLIQYPLQDYEDQGGIAQAGQLMLGAPGGSFFYYADNDGLVRRAARAAAIANFKFQVQLEDLIDFQFVNSNDYGRSNPIFKITGTEGSAGVCGGDGTTVQEFRKTKGGLYPTVLFGNLEEVVVEEVTTEVTTVGNTRTTIVTKRVQQIFELLYPGGNGAISNVRFDGLRTRFRTTTVDTYNGSDCVTNRDILEEVALKINGIIDENRIVERKRTIYELQYDLEGNLTDRTQRVFERFIAVNNRVFYSPFALFSPNSELVEIGGLVETWRRAGCKWQFTQTLQPAQRETRNLAVTAEIDDDGLLNSELVDTPASGWKKPPAYETVSEQREAIAYADINGCTPPFLKTTQEAVEYVHDEATLQNLAGEEIDLLWGRSFAQKIVMPITDYWLDAVNNDAENLPFFRVDVLTPEGDNYALLWNNFQIDIDGQDALIELDAPMIGLISAPGGAVTKQWTTRTTSAKLNVADKGDAVIVTDRGFTATIPSGSTENIRATVAISGSYYFEVHRPSPELKIGVMTAADDLNAVMGAGNGFAHTGTYGKFDVIGVALNTTTNTLTFYKNGVLVETINSVTGTLFPALGGDGTDQASGRLAIMDRVVSPVPDGFTPYG